MKTAVFLLFAAAVWAQPLRVYSEFAKIDAAGKVTAPAEPREILSPAIARNAFSSFQIVVDVPRGTPYQLYVAQNPENAVEVTLYHENGDVLTRVEQPVSGNSTQVFWMDLWTARDASVARIKVEPQLHVNNDWVIYPMEARVVETTVAAASAEALRNYVCRAALKPPPTDFDSGTGLRFRNFLQDAALASKAPREELQKLLSACDAPPPTDPEWYLRVRDYLLRLPQTVR